MQTLKLIKRAAILLAAALTLAGCEKSESVNTSGIRMNKTTLIIPEGSKRTLTATVTPESALSWSSSDESIATVSNAGVVHAIAQGTATINVSTVDGSKKTQCAVTVTKPTKSMSMTTEMEGEARIWLAGTGEAHIYWGDGSELETINLKQNGLGYSHPFSVEPLRHTINIEGENITYFKCADMQLTAIDVSKNPALEIFICAENWLTDLNVSNNPALKILHCYNNGLYDIDVTNNVMLTSLVCFNNRSTKLDITNNPALEYLSCSGNHLTSLEVTNNTKLTYLNCSSNELTNLDVTNNTALTYLDCVLNDFNGDGLDALFGTLHSNDMGEKTIDIAYNPGRYECHTSIAERNGWTVKYFQ